MLWLLASWYSCHCPRVLALSQITCLGYEKVGSSMKNYQHCLCMHSKSFKSKVLLMTVGIVCLGAVSDFFCFPYWEWRCCQYFFWQDKTTVLKNTLCEDFCISDLHGLKNNTERAFNFRKRNHFYSFKNKSLFCRPHNKRIEWFQLATLLSVWKASFIFGKGFYIFTVVAMGARE